MRAGAREYPHPPNESGFAARRARSDGLLRLALLCTLVAWLLAVLRLYVALVHREHGLDAVLAAMLSVALPGVAAAAVASAFVRSRRAPDAPDNVVFLKKHGRP
jgi:hypothetical protein